MHDNILIVKWLTVVVIMLIASSIAWTEEFRDLRRAIAKILTPVSKPTKEAAAVQAALDARATRHNSYVVEYLGYGFTHRESIAMADTRIQREAQEALKDADGVLGTKS
jgi:hypothetical protein